MSGKRQVSRPVLESTSTPMLHHHHHQHNSSISSTLSALSSNSESADRSFLELESPVSYYNDLGGPATGSAESAGSITPTTASRQGSFAFNMSALFGSSSRRAASGQHGTGDKADLRIMAPRPR
ncbi:hypothetical protein AA313_de0204733 [Arthrobotrys entomopaga]|nr:hypothetical protein AA313_de0204733 [Arthrobotrys entomopaga]